MPLDPAHVRLYVCGPTVYDYVHIGNARPVVAFDVLYRLLKRRYPRVTYVRNITDIDDRIIARAADNKESDRRAHRAHRRGLPERHEAAGRACRPIVEPRATAVCRPDGRPDRRA